ncbi:LOW QUALITY PROTEIN: hypothetical protein HID58_076503, partial [Brassica napus]
FFITVSFFYVLSSFFFLCIHVSSLISGNYTIDTISGNVTLFGVQSLVSSNGIFEMGFFQPAGSFSKFYIGMSYQQVYQQTIVWVANRDEPVSDMYISVLKISDGNLVLFDGRYETPVWSPGLNSSSAHEAVLLDDGNLVLRDESGSVLWQSFDHPCDTWLPGARIRYDKRTKKSTQRLTSWKSSEDPSPGLFSLELDESTAYKVLWNGSAQYWSSGPWNPQRNFGLDNSAKSTLTVAPMGFAMTSPNLFANALLMDWDLKDYSGGCVRKMVLGVKSLGSCGSACLGNCSCMGYAHEESSNQCLIWSEEHVLNLQQLEGNNSEGSTFILDSGLRTCLVVLLLSNKAMIFTAVVLGSLGVMISF